MAHPGLKKRVSIGLTLSMSEQEFKGIIDHFEAFIGDLYFSPPFGRAFHSRLEVASNLEPSRGVEDDVIDILRYGSDRGIQINMALNTCLVTPNEALGAVRRIRDRVPLGTVTTTTQYAGHLKEAFPDLDLTCSYNQGIKTPSDVDRIAETGLFSGVVLGNSTLRDFPLFGQVKALGMKTRLLLNNGCTFRCGDFCGPSSNCKQTFDEAAGGRGLHALYAEQSIQPWELHEHYVDRDDIHTFKISNRPADQAWLFNCLNSYAENINRDLILDCPSNYHLWARLTHFCQRARSLDYDRIQERKHDIWRNILTGAGEI